MMFHVISAELMEFLSFPLPPPAAGNIFKHIFFPNMHFYVTSTSSTQRNAVTATCIWGPQGERVWDSILFHAGENRVFYRMCNWTQTVSHDIQYVTYNICDDFLAIHLQILCHLCCASITRPFLD